MSIALEQLPSARKECRGCEHARSIGTESTLCGYRRTPHTVSHSGQCPKSGKSLKARRQTSTASLKKVARQSKIEIRENDVLICTGCRNDWPAQEWLYLTANRTGFEGSKMVVPIEVYNKVKDKFFDDTKE